MDFTRDLIMRAHVANITIPTGYSVVSSELCKICAQLLKILSHNKAVFGRFYASIIDSF